MSQHHRPGQGQGQDDELRELLGDDETLLAAASEVGEVLRRPEIDPRFMRELRLQLVRERRRVLAEREERRRSGWRRLLRPRPAFGLAGGLAAAGLALVLALNVLPGHLAPGPAAVVASSTVVGQSSVDPSSAVLVRFDRPMNHADVEASLHVSPATTTRTSWRGNDLVVQAVHGLAPNAPYVLSLDRTVARTADGAALASDVRLVFGTAPVASPGGSRSPVVLPVRTVAPADDGSEALVGSDGSLFATSASLYGFSGLLHVQPVAGTLERLSGSTNAICLSRSGRSLAFLTGSGAGTSIVMAAGDGSNRQTVHVPVDDGSPLGWIGDQQVSFVSGGHLEAVDRAGHVSVLNGTAIDAAHDTVVIAQGGRYAFWRPSAGSATPGRGQLIDLVGRSAHPLTGIVDDPAFSADGATVAWFDGSGSGSRLAVAPSAGGPVLSLPLPVAAGDHLSDLGLDTGGGRFVYSVQLASGRAELRLASLTTGATLAVSMAGKGESPNWSAAGGEVSVLGHSGSQGEIQLADTAVARPTTPMAAEALATAFANAQLSGDADAMRSLAAASVNVSRLPRGTRASAVEVLPAADGSVRVNLRIVTDPTADHPVARVATESLVLRQDRQLGHLVVAGASATAASDATAGPHVVRVASGPGTGTVSVTFDSDLDAASVDAVGLRSAAGTALAARPAYDAATRTVTLTSPTALSGTVTVTVGTDLRDVSGGHPAAPVQAPVAVAAGA